MRRASQTSRPVLIAILALVLIGVVAFAATTGSGVSAGSAQVPAAATAKDAAADFGVAYLRLLEGTASAAGLPDATPAVRRTAAETTIPAADRGADPTVVSVTVTSAGTAARATVIARDARHTYPTQLALSAAGGGWVVSGLVPPDVSTILAPVRRAGPVPAAVLAAARSFAPRYVDYREGVEARAPAGLSQLRQELAARQDALGRITPTHRPAVLTGVSFGPFGNGPVAVTATLRDAGHRLKVVFFLKRTGSHARWQPWWVEPKG
jgi:hypothetical protein